MGKIMGVRGFKDILPGETEKWQYVEEAARSIFTNFGIQEIKIPILEKTELFKRGIGETTDIVEKEMYTFLDRGKEYVTLRPEATASVLRAYIENHMYSTDPMVKLFTIGPMFRRERPQKGRFRQFHQINVEILGEKDPHADAELLFMLMYFLNTIGIDGLNLEINSLGCPQCRLSFRENVVSILKEKEQKLCPDCRRRLEKNPLRVFDCKVETCQDIISDVPTILDFICPACRRHFESVQNYLQSLDVPFEINTKLVRGLDYYVQTAFEITGKSLGAQNSVAGGGRYDGLVNLLGGPDIPGIGFAVGIERLVSMIPDKGDQFIKKPHIFIAALGESAQAFAFVITVKLRLSGIRTEMDYSDKSLKSQMKRANKLNSRYTLIVGEKEIEENKAQLRNMETGTQQTVGFHNIDDIIKIIKESE